MFLLIFCKIYIGILSFLTVSVLISLSFFEDKTKIQIIQFLFPVPASQKITYFLVFLVIIGCTVTLLLLIGLFNKRKILILPWLIWTITILIVSLNTKKNPNLTR